uniref:C-type lectin domain-containing protein n=1 Tax=Periophthalmus magnuspinnatus TaxID=409849 RepID=A0A3B4AUJ9_9GOBI
GEPNNWGGNEHCVNQNKTWTDAQTYCRTQYDDLASVTSQEVLLDLLNQMTFLGQLWAWIGLYRDPWTTWSDSTNTSFYNWGTEPPIYNTDDHCGCLTAATGEWHVTPCSGTYKFLCYGGTFFILPF